MSGRRRRLAAASVAVVLAAGCGSTVAGVSSGSATLSQGGQGLAGPTTPGAPAPGASAAAGGGLSVPGSTSATTSGAAGGGTVTGPASGSTAAGATTTSTGAGATSAATGPGITATKVYMAVPYSSDTAAGDQAVGAAGAAPSYDGRDVFNAVINYANAHGGFAGRQLSPLYFNYSVSSDQSSQDQSACANWTQDHKVFVITTVDDILRACAEKAGAVSMAGGNDVASTFQRFPHFVDPYFMRLDRMGSVTVNGLVRSGYFSGKLGFLTWDDPSYRDAYTHGYVPALAAHHVTLTDKAFIAVPQQLGALGDMTAAISSVITRFRSEGIDHVIIQDGPAGVWAGTGLTLEFMNQAESQKYYPRYGQNALNSPGWSGLPSDQMNKAIAIMDSDYRPEFDEGWHPNQTREKCFKIEADAGYPVRSSNQNDENIAAQACDIVFFTQLVFSRMHSMTSDGFISAVAGLGRDFSSAYVYGTQFAPGLRDGSAAVRSAEYLASCKCLKYSGAPYYPS